jgi:signal transduction histidine kinase
MPGGDEPTVFALVRDITEQIEENRALREGYQALTKRLRDLDAQLGDARARGERIAQQTGELLRTSNQVLRSGLRNVRGLVGLVQQEVDAGRVDQARQSTGLIDQAASRMEAVLDGLAGLASVDSQPLERRPVDMRRCVRLALETAARGHPGLSVTSSMADDLPATQADAMQMVMLWRQLVDNAYQFSAGSLQPKLRIDAHRPDGRTWWRITDNGRGIDPTRAERLFRPFQRLHAAPDADSQGPGLGLGLALVQRIVERHEGEVRARSNPGVGTVIEFCLEPRRGAA